MRATLTPWTLIWCTPHCGKVISFPPKRVAPKIFQPISFVCRNYTPTNSNDFGDGWNTEDLSIFSPCQVRSWMNYSCCLFCQGLHFARCCVWTPFSPCSVLLIVLFSYCSLGIHAVSCHPTTGWHCCMTGAKQLMEESIQNESST